MLLPGAAAGFEIDVGNPDLKVRWDNSVRYNLGVRMQDQDRKILNNSNYDDSDSKFDKHDVVTNRLDLLSELDVIYKRAHGFRVSAAAWNDWAYSSSRVRTNPMFTFPGLGDTSTAYLNNEYTDYVKRWNRGPSGEFLDVFLFTNFDLGQVPVSVKLGQHNVYWGESLFSFVHGVSYSQGPVDVRKAYVNPGVEAKELYKPLTQLSISANVLPELTIAGQYFFDWRPSPIPDGGTYFGILDPITLGGGTFVVNPALAAATSGALGGVPVAPVPFVGVFDTPKKRGDWGLMAKWRPQWFDGSLGVYYREYTDKMPQIVLGGLQAAPLALGVGLPTSMGLSYLEDNKLIGLSLSTNIGGVSVGSEVVHRRNTGLLMGPATIAGMEPRGDTWHFLVNALAFMGKNAAFDSATLLAELTYSRLDKVTRNEANFNSVDYFCKAAADQFGCADKDAWGLAMKFEPLWYQVMPGVDLSMPIVLNTGLNGNSPVLFGGYERNGSYSIGFTADLNSKYSFNLAYNGYFGRRKSAATAASLGEEAVTSINGLGALWDRGWLSFTFKTTF